MGSANVVVRCDDGASFHAANGDSIHSLNELSDSLERMDDGCFMHHVHEGKNDFANWVKHVLLDVTLSERLVAAHDRKSAQILVLKRMMENAIEVLK